MKRVSRNKNNICYLVKKEDAIKYFKIIEDEFILDEKIEEIVENNCRYHNEKYTIDIFENGFGTKKENELLELFGEYNIEYEIKKR
jgi:hypothetical protein